MASSISHHIARIAVLAPNYPPAFRGGGPIRSLEAMTKRASADTQPFILTSDRDFGATEALPVVANTWTARDNVDVYYASLSSPRHYWRALRALRERRPQLVYVNSFFNPLLSIIPVILWRLKFWRGASLLIAPRGEFGTGALTRHAARKRIYMFIFRALRLTPVVMWHSTAEHESDDIRRIWGKDAEIILRPNDTLLPAVAIPPIVEPRSPLRIVFLGRIVEHKGLAIALQALTRNTNPIIVNIYGVAEDPTYIEHCQEIASSLPTATSVKFHGQIEPSQVGSVLAEHDLLALPTAGENFGHVIAEALSASCIVVTTPYTPWTDILHCGAGVVVPDRSIDAWEAAIDPIIHLTTEQRLAWRARAGELYSEWASQPKPEHIWTAALRVIPS